MECQVLIANGPSTYLCRTQGSFTVVSIVLTEKRIGVEILHCSESGLEIICNNMLFDIFSKTSNISRCLFSGVSQSCVAELCISPDSHWAWQRHFPQYSLNILRDLQCFPMRFLQLGNFYVWIYLIFRQNIRGCLTHWTFFRKYHCIIMGYCCVFQSLKLKDSLFISWDSSWHDEA